jgi:hypothetical protein
MIEKFQLYFLAFICKNMITISRTTLEFSNQVALFFNLCKLCYVLEEVGKQSEKWGDYRVYLVKFLFDQGRLEEH